MNTCEVCKLKSKKKICKKCKSFFTSESDYLWFKSTKDAHFKCLFQELVSIANSMANNELKTTLANKFYNLFSLLNQHPIMGDDFREVKHYQLAKNNYGKV